MITRARRASNGPRLRPRVGSWFEVLLPRDIFQAGPLIYVLITLAHGSPVVWPYLGVLLLLTAWKIRAEYTSHPAVLRYWKDETGCPLNVRSTRTGVLLLQSETASLAHAQLPGAHLAGANLSGMDLHGADLKGADLSGANLRSAQLAGANLEGALLRGADLCFSGLRGTSLQGVDLSYASLGGADLTEASLHEADLRGADLVGRGLNATRSGEALERTTFTGARWNQATRWPRGFEPAKHGCVFLDEQGEGLPLPAQAAAQDRESLPVPISLKLVEESSQVVARGSHDEPLESCACSRRVR